MRAGVIITVAACFSVTSCCWNYGAAMSGRRGYYPHLGLVFHFVRFLLFSSREGSRSVIPAEAAAMPSYATDRQRCSCCSNSTTTWLNVPAVRNCMPAQVSPPRE